MQTRFPLALRALAVLLLAAAASFPTGRASADREHRVRQGQTLSTIARRYHVSVQSLASANGLRSGSTLRVGQVLVIPTGDTVTVRRGATLGSIAREHGISASDLAEANGLRANARLRPGQELVLPGNARAVREAGGGGEWGRPRRPGVVKMIRFGKRDRLETRLVDTRGRARSGARRSLGRLMRSDDGTVRAPNPRLLSVLTKVSDHFGGRRIVVISGFRPPGGYTRETSRHTRGDAIDLRIDGVPVTAIRDYCRTLPDLGCGYYPRSQFVHVDVRDRAAYWIDWSGPGEAPQYRRPANATEDATGADEASAADEGGEAEGAVVGAPDGAPSP
ncbi:MAG: LysM peptidoglycan-binding domain-containing protein [Polyangiales bacterium]